MVAARGVSIPMVSCRDSRAAKAIGLPEMLRQCNRVSRDSRHLLQAIGSLSVTMKRAAERRGLMSRAVATFTGRVIASLTRHASRVSCRLSGRRLRYPLPMRLPVTAVCLALAVVFLSLDCVLKDDYSRVDVQLEMDHAPARGETATVRAVVVPEEDCREMRFYASLTADATLVSSDFRLPLPFPLGLSRGPRRWSSCRQARRYVWRCR